MTYVDNAYYHVYNRGAHKAKLFLNDAHYLFCQKKLTLYADKYKIGLLAYCLMPNHYHLLVQQNENGSVSRFLQTVFNSFTQFINAREGHSGTLFQGRAQSRQINSDEYLLVALRYIHLNPVHSGLAINPEEWKFSDYSEWISDEPIFHFGVIEKTRMDFRNRYFVSGTEYQKFIMKSMSEAQMQYWNEIATHDVN
jgi:putative transposase